MIRKTYNWTIEQSKKKHAMAMLAFISVIESIFFLIPSDVFIMAIGLSDRKKAFKAAGIATVFSVIGGLLAYLIGAFLYDSVGQFIISSMGYADKFDKFTDLYLQWGPWIVALGGLTPFPYKVITLASGFSRLNIFVFIFSSLIARAMRYFLIAALIWKYGERAREIIDRHLGKLTVIFFLLLFGSFYLIKYI